MRSGAGPGPARVRSAAGPRPAARRPGLGRERGAGQLQATAALRGLCGLREAGAGGGKKPARFKFRIAGRLRRETPASDISRVLEINYRWRGYLHSCNLLSESGFGSYRWCKLHCCLVLFFFFFFVFLLWRSLLYIF